MKPKEPKAYYTHWKTKDGRMLLPEEMETGHLVNALNMVARLCRHAYLQKARESTSMELSALRYADTAPDGAAMAAEMAAADFGQEWALYHSMAFDNDACRSIALRTFPITKRMEEIVIKRRRAGLPERGLLKIQQVNDL